MKALGTAKVSADAAVKSCSLSRSWRSVVLLGNHNDVVVLEGLKLYCSTLHFRVEHGHTTGIELPTQEKLFSPPHTFPKVRKLNAQLCLAQVLTHRHSVDATNVAIWMQQSEQHIEGCPVSRCHRKYAGLECSSPEEGHVCQLGLQMVALFKHTLGPNALDFTNDVLARTAALWELGVRPFEELPKGQRRCQTCRVTEACSGTLVGEDHDDVSRSQWQFGQDLDFSCRACVMDELETMFSWNVGSLQPPLLILFRNGRKDVDGGASGEIARKGQQDATQTCSPVDHYDGVRRLGTGQGAERYPGFLHLQVWPLINDLLTCHVPCQHHEPISLPDLVHVRRHQVWPLTVKGLHANADHVALMSGEASCSKVQHAMRRRHFQVGRIHKIELLTVLEREERLENVGNERMRCL
mmetsp:Transcript_39469/g.91606  ORF Transcript_39469/g.91606 Transcript_39469/m.91606 type:complete len:410 (-) Transcript_39469:1108-2337(-)